MTRPIPRSRPRRRRPAPERIGPHRYAECLPSTFIDEPCRTCSYVGPEVDAQGRCEACRVVKNENAPRQHAPTQLDHELAAAVMAAPRSNK